MAAVSVSPAAPAATVDACVVSCSAADANDTTAHDLNAYPMDPEIRYYFSAEAAGVDSLVSHVFAPNGGAHEWDNVIFPEAGSWTVHLRLVSDDSSVANAAVTVS